MELPTGGTYAPETSYTYPLPSATALGTPNGTTIHCSGDLPRLASSISRHQGTESDKSAPIDPLRTLGESGSLLPTELGATTKVQPESLFQCHPRLNFPMSHKSVNPGGSLGGLVGITSHSSGVANCRYSVNPEFGTDSGAPSR